MQIALAALKRFFDAEAEVVYINAPHPASGPAYAEVQTFFKGPYYEWWNAIQVSSVTALLRRHIAYHAKLSCCQTVILTFLPLAIVKPWHPATWPHHYAAQEGTGNLGSGPVDSSDKSVWKYQGMDESLKFLEQYMQEHGPFDGLMGFSQGASVSSLVALLQHKGIMFQVRCCQPCSFDRD